MNYKIHAFVFSFILFGCKHPEGEKYERNQGIKNEDNSFDNSSKGQIIEPVVISESESDTNEENRNILKMELENGVRYVWIEINNIKLRFIFDTGASTICISPAEATVLYRQGTLSREDILDVEYFQDATGKISEGTRINLRTVKIGEIILNNVEAIVIDNVDAPLLLGQSALKQFGKISIDYHKNEINFE
jgi:aspartyl protease family protein